MLDSCWADTSCVFVEDINLNDSYLKSNRSSIFR